MSDLLSGFGTQAVSATINQKKYSDRCIIDNPVLHKEGTGELIVLLDLPYTSKQLYRLKAELRNNAVYNYTLLSVLSFKPTNKDLDKQVVKFYTENKINLHDYIPQWSKVISIGRAIYSITESDDLNIEGFRDTLLNHTSFFSPEYKIQVFPVGDTNSIFTKTTFDFYWFGRQLAFARKFTLPKTRLTKPKLVYVDNPNQFLLEHINDNVPLAWDTETKYLNPFIEESRVLCLTLSFDGKTGYYLDWDKIDTSILEQFMYGKQHILANAKFDFLMLTKKGGINPRAFKTILWDTVQASHTINEMQRNGLKSDSWLYTKLGGYDRELEKYKESHPEAQNDYSKIPFDILFPYATIDPIATFQIYEKQLKVIKELDSKYPLNNGWSVERYIREIRVPSVYLYFNVELQGMSVNPEYMKINSEEIRQQLYDIEENILTDFGKTSEELKISSTEQLGRAIEKLGWRIDERAKKGHPLTGEEQLTRWSQQGHKLADKLLKYREISTQYKNFIGSPEENNGLFQYIDDDGRVHSNFKVMLTNSHRNKTSNPNCFPPSVEVLTDKGWLHWDKLDKTEKLAQFDETQKEITFVKPLDYVEYDFEGELIHLSTAQQIDIISTPDHRFLLENRKTGKQVTVTASNFLDNHRAYSLNRDLKTITYISTKDFSSVRLPYSGKVYCATMPKDTLIVRYNDKVMVTRNSQNYPSHGQKAITFRRAIAPPSQYYKFLSSDYSGLQLRIAGILSQDPELKKAFIQLGGDIHSMTGSSVILNNKYTLEEFLKLKEEDNEEIVEARFRAKGVNFSLIFNTTAYSFARESLYDEWSKEDAEKFIQDNKDTLIGKSNLIKTRDRRRAVMEGKEKKRTNSVYNANSQAENDIEFRLKMFADIGDKDHFANCWTIASLFSNRFFNKYRKLKQWLDSTIEFANTYGYSRSYHGAFRRLPELLYQPTSEKGNATLSGKIKNLQNISVNSPVQNFEVVVVNRWLLNLLDYIEENNLKSYIFGQIHDAGEFFSFNEEEEEFVAKVKEYGEKMYTEYNGIPLTVESNLADYWGTYELSHYEKNKDTGELEKIDDWQLWDKGKKI